MLILRSINIIIMKFLYNHNGLIKYIHKVDQLRSLYCLKLDNKILKKNYTKSKNIILFANCPWYLFNFRKDLLEQLNKKGYRLILISSKDRYYKKISKYFIKYENCFFTEDRKILYLKVSL